MPVNARIHYKGHRLPYLWHNSTAEKITWVGVDWKWGNGTKEFL